MLERHLPRPLSLGIRRSPLIIRQGAPIDHRAGGVVQSWIPLGTLRNRSGKERLLQTFHISTIETVAFTALGNSPKK
jgi:hypothetical protein